jgi:hypothetical protein
MRLAYISLHWPRTRNSGVGKKIDSQVKTWASMGHDVCLFMHTSRYEPASSLIDAVVFPYEGRGKLFTELDRVRAASQMVKTVETFKPDLIYLRYGIYVYPIHLLMKIAPVVEEINTNDLTQHEELGGVYSLYNRLTRGILLRRVRGLVTVSHELGGSPAFASYKKSTRTIANGIDLNSIDPLPAPDNKSPRLAFMGTPGYPWHGVDKLIEFARRFPDLQLDIIGYAELTGFGPLPRNVNLRGYLPSAEYRQVLSGADVAISSLALHRVQLSEASPLKSRECLAFGIPMVIAYKDTDLDDLDCDFLLKIPNKEDNIQTHGEAIREFAYRMCGLRVDRSRIQRIDQMQKERERLQFFSEIVNAE